MRYFIREFKELYQAWLTVLCFFCHPKWLANRLHQDDAIEYAMVSVKKSIALMVMVILTLSLLFSEFTFVQADEKPGEVFAVLLVHGAIVSLVLAGAAWLWFRNGHEVGLLVGWFILVYWVPLWFWNMVFEIHVGFSGEQYSNLFLDFAHGHMLHDWHVYFLVVTWLHAAAVGIYGLHCFYQLKSIYLWLLGLVSALLFLLSFLLVHHAHRGVELIYLIFGMG